MKKRRIVISILLPAVGFVLGWHILTGGVLAKPQMVEVGGSLTEDTVWTAVNSPYILTTTVHIPAGVTLTVEPGVTVLGKSFGGIIVEGNIVAIGTATNPITFTSITDSAPGEWPGIYFWDGSGHFEHAAIRYGGENIWGSLDDPPPHGTNINIEDIREGAKIIIRDSTISGSIGLGLVMPSQNLHQVELDDVEFTENITNRIKIETSSILPITRNITLTAQPGLEGYEINSSIVVAQNTLTLKPGTSLMFPKSGAIVLQGGHLEAIGTPEKPITFTTRTDLAIDRWGGILFWGGSAHFNHTKIRFGGNAVLQPANSALYVYEVPSENAVILENSTIFSSGEYAIIVEVDELHQLHLKDNVYLENVRNRILILPDYDGITNVIADSVELPYEDGLESYELLAPGLVVPNELTLTVEAGASMMITPTAAIMVSGGHLEAVGTKEQPILFTSSSENGGGEWEGLILEEGTAVFEHVEIREAVNNLTVNNTAVTQPVTIQNSWIHSASNNGLVLNDGVVTASCTTFNHNGNAGVLVTNEGAPDLLISNSNIINNGGDGLLNANDIQVRAQDNWWGDSSGPGGIGSGSGSIVQGNVLFEPWALEEFCVRSYELYLPSIIVP